MVRTSKSSIYNGTDLCKGWSLQDHTTNKVFGRSIVTLRAVNQDRREDVFQRIDIDTMKIVNAIVDTRITCGPEVGDISLGKEICNVGCRIDDRSPDDSNGIRDIVASDFGLQEWRMNLSSVERSTSPGVHGSDPILGRGKKNKLWAPGKRSVDQRFGIEL